MWLGLFLFLIAVLTLIGAAFAGAIFTMILVPIGVIAVIAALLVGTALQRLGVGRPSRRQVRKEREHQADPGHAEVTPDEFVDIRRRQSRPH